MDAAIRLTRCSAHTHRHTSLCARNRMVSHTVIQPIGHKAPTLPAAQYTVYEHFLCNRAVKMARSAPPTQLERAGMPRRAGCKMAHSASLAQPMLREKLSPPVKPTAKTHGRRSDTSNPIETFSRLSYQKENRLERKCPSLFINAMVGLTGFEPATPASRTQCSTKLSHNPKCSAILTHSEKKS